MLWDNVKKKSIEYSVTDANWCGIYSESPPLHMLYALPLLWRRRVPIDPTDAREMDDAPGVEWGQERSRQEQHNIGITSRPSKQIFLIVWLLFLLLDTYGRAQVSAMVPPTPAGRHVRQPRSDGADQQRRRSERFEATRGPAESSDPTTHQSAAHQEVTVGT